MEGPMLKLTSRRAVALATLAAIAAGFAAPAFAVPYNRNGVERGDLVYLPTNSGCIANPSCDLARY